MDSNQTPRRKSQNKFSVSLQVKRMLETENNKIHGRSNQHTRTFIASMRQPINAREQNHSTTSTTGRVCQTPTQKQSTTTGRVCQTPTQKQSTTTTGRVCQTPTQKQSTTTITGRVCQTPTQKQSTTTITGRVCQTPTQKQSTTTGRVCQTPTQKQSTTTITGRVCQTPTQKQSTTTITGRVCQTPTQKQCTTTTTDDGPTTQLATSLIHQYEDESPPEKNKQVIKQNPGSVILSQDKTNLRVMSGPPLNAKPKDKHESFEDFFTKHINFFRTHMGRHYNFSHSKCTTSTRRHLTFKQNYHPSELTIFHQNADRLSNKIDIMNDLLTNINPDIVIITEHGLSKQKLENTHLEGYTIIESFCREKHKKGGVAIWVKDGIKTYAVGLGGNRLSQELICEVSTAKLTIGKQAIYIIGIYRPNINFDAP
ncbi:hypothetical protein J6590_045945 [Homalodisca vitripennis]|nr:hypothetical protein J6590_045945 [Homalodisca vitripennis]